MGLTVALAAACAQPTDDLLGGSGTSAGSDHAGTAGDGGGGTLDWSSCGPAECAGLDVPVDHGDPSGPTLRISVARVPATGHRTGALFVNPGGPGATASDFAVTMASLLPSSVTDRFDVVGVDPRGLGASDISCGGDVDALYAVDYSIDSPADTTALLDVSRDYVDGCRRRVGDLLPHLGTEDVARDIDAVRAAMGDEQLSYLGFSYGTAVGQVLAQVAPRHVRAMVLDGIVDLGPSGVATAVAQAAGFEAALASFAADCDGDPSCPLAPHAMAAVERLQARVEARPIAGEEARDLGPGRLATALAMPLYSQQLWPDLARAVADALDGDPAGMLALADQYLSTADFDVYFAANCLDWEWPEEPQEVLRAGAAAADRSPHFGEPIVNDYVRCAMWPVDERPIPAVTAPHAPPVLVISTTNDPATPYEAGVRAARRLARGILVTYEGEGHTVVGNGVACVDDLVADYLVDLDEPDDDTIC